MANPGGYGSYSYFPPEALMLAMNQYEGQKDFGLELARKVWNNITCIQGYTWDMPNIMRGDVDTGERTFGNDYYQDMMLGLCPRRFMDRPSMGLPSRAGWSTECFRLRGSSSRFRIYSAGRVLSWRAIRLSLRNLRRNHSIYHKRRRGGWDQRCLLLADSCFEQHHHQGKGV